MLTMKSMSTLQRIRRQIRNDDVGVQLLEDNKHKIDIAMLFLQTLEAQPVIGFLDASQHAWMLAIE